MQNILHLRSVFWFRIQSFQGLGFKFLGFKALGFYKVHRLGNLKTLALRRCLSMLKDKHTAPGRDITMSVGSKYIALCKLANCGWQKIWGVPKMELPPDHPS